MDEHDGLEPPGATYRGRSVDELFGEVRSIVNGPPSRQAFEELVRILDAWPEGRRDALPMSYLDAVRRWRPLLRMAPKRWRAERLAGREVPWFGIVGGVDLWSNWVGVFDEPWFSEYEGLSLRTLPYDEFEQGGGEAAGWARVEERFRAVRGASWRELSLSIGAPESFHEALCSHEASRSLEALELSGTHHSGLDDEVVGRWARGWFERHPQLERLGFDGQPIFDAFMEVYGQDDARRLRHLNVQGVDMDREAFERMLGFASLSELESLTWRHWTKTYQRRFDGRALEALARAPMAKTLEALELTNQRLTGADLGHLRALPRLRSVGVRGNDLVGVDEGALVGINPSLRAEDVSVGEQGGVGWPSATVEKLEAARDAFSVFVVCYVLPPLIGFGAAAWAWARGLEWWEQALVTSVAWPATWWSSGGFSDALVNAGMDLVSPRRRVTYALEAAVYAALMCAAIAAVAMYWV